MTKEAGMITLDTQERWKFAAYLRQESDAEMCLIRQMEKVDIPKAMIDHKKGEAVILRRAADWLASWEEV